MAQLYEEILNFLPTSKYLTLGVIQKDEGLALAFMDIEKRLNDIEFKSKQNKRVKATRAQKVLIFHHLGLLDKLMEQPTSTARKAKILSILLDEDKDNLEGDMSTINHPKSELKKDFNYKFVKAVFEEARLDELAETSEAILTQIEAEKEKKDKK